MKNEVSHTYSWVTFWFQPPYVDLCCYFKVETCSLCHLSNAAPTPRSDNSLLSLLLGAGSLLVMSMGVMTTYTDDLMG